MELNKYFVLGSFLFIYGCASVSPEQKAMYEQGYREGVKEQMTEIASKFQGGNFPYYQWTAPIVQDVLVPAHIEHGVFIPEHKELVIIKPGEWMKSPAYPIQSQENKNHEEINPNNVSTMSDITFVPASKRE